MTPTPPLDLSEQDTHGIAGRTHTPDPAAVAGDVDDGRAFGGDFKE